MFHMTSLPLFDTTRSIFLCHFELGTNYVILYLWRFAKNLKITKILKSQNNRPQDSILIHLDADSMTISL